jgi:hypothetical protein
MKVVHRSDQRLILEDQPWLIGLMLILMALGFLAGALALLGRGEMFGGLMMGLIGAGVPLLIAALLVQRVRLTLDRVSGRITRTSRSVRGLRQQSHALDRLTGARVDASTDSDGTTYRLVLLLSDPTETVPFTSYYSSSRKPGELVEVVNDWAAGR